jgi:hypothetical protein
MVTNPAPAAKTSIGDNGKMSFQAILPACHQIKRRIIAGSTTVDVLPVKAQRNRKIDRQ